LGKMRHFQSLPAHDWGGTSLAVFVVKIAESIVKIKPLN